MPVLSENEGSTDERSDCYLHIQNLPWSAGRKDITEYFKELSIKEGEIVLRGAEAFVSFEDPLDLTEALGQEERLLHGSSIQLSSISKDELQQALMRLARRKLSFEPANEVSELSLPRAVKRKIRPTPISMGRKKRAVSKSVFLPEEIRLPSPQHVANKPVISRKKKVHPTKISDDMEVNTFAIFHPEMCYEFKNIKLATHVLCAIEI